MNNTPSHPRPDDPFDLNRFVQAQEEIYAGALSELRKGRKQSHWMWFIFPQVRGLGSSPTAYKYAIQDLDEARAYLAHPLLGPRLIECSSTLLRIQSCSAADIFGYPDDLKLRSSMTLFAALSPTDPVFGKVLEKYFAGQPDSRTLEILKESK